MGCAVSADDTRALRMLAAGDRVQEAHEAERSAREARDMLDRADASDADCERMHAAWVRTIDARNAAVREHTAIALEPGDCAWEIGVLGAAGVADSEGGAR